METIKGMLPEGAEAFKSKFNEVFTVTLDKEGVYGVKCAPHYGMGNRPDRGGPAGQPRRSEGRQADGQGQSRVRRTLRPGRGGQVARGQQTRNGADGGGRVKEAEVTDRADRQAWRQGAPTTIPRSGRKRRGDMTAATRATASPTSSAGLPFPRRTGGSWRTGCRRPRQASFLIPCEGLPNHPRSFTSRKLGHLPSAGYKRGQRRT
ncbi:hypothetical protein BQ8794_220228 [Mesorhizobium prunaredense]|uniref:Blue (type 1) copper domain-containing protein n=1 Tax=Mesorhizobium prunaredense TaxID=1631249 RepID=A0A1R3V6Y6_9HYPH|nr:hypothetical protein BQ8794_220228 [Mesorhizobium prunaredense]